MRVAVGVLSLAAVITSQGYSGNLDVLWFTTGTGDGGSFASYEDGVRNLTQHASQLNGQNVWNVTFWNAGFDPAATPLGAYSVLVVAPPEFSDGTDYSALNSNFPMPRDRVVVTGIESDRHYEKSFGPVDSNGPFGVLAYAVSRAGVGAGSGAVFPAPQTIIGWGLAGLGNDMFYDSLDSVGVPNGGGTHPINSGLIADGLSNLSTSAKQARDTLDFSSWSVLHVTGDGPTKATALVRMNTQSDPGLPVSTTPEAATAPLLLAAIVCLGMLRRKRIR